MELRNGAFFFKFVLFISLPMADSSVAIDVDGLDITDDTSDGITPDSSNHRPVSEDQSDEMQPADRSVLSHDTEIQVC